MFQLKPIDATAVPKALEKAERYRLLSEPEEAESICLDVLAIEPNNQDAIRTLLLALTDQFRHGGDPYTRAQELVSQLHGEYERLYYGGIICERWGNAHLDKGGPGSHPIACALLHRAMERYEQAEAIRPPQNDDAILRWNTCARIIMKHHLEMAEETYEPALLE
jgi:hypothetical protein